MLNQPNFLSIQDQDLPHFFQEIGPQYSHSSNPSCIPWMLLALCDNDTDFFNKLRHELFNLLVTDTEKGRELNQANILELADFLELPNYERQQLRPF